MTSTLRRIGVPLLGIGAIGLVLAMLLVRFYRDPTFLPPDDFVQYWAAAHLAGHGENPYDADRLREVERAIGRDDGRAVIMWNPPWSLPLFYPFGLVDARTGQLFWLVVQLAFVLGSVDRLWVLYGGENRYRGFALFLASCWFSTGYLLLSGQSSGWVLMGATGFLWATRRGKLWSVLFAAAAVKPHLLIPIWLILALEGITSRRSRPLLVWGVGAGLLLIIMAVAIDPEIVTHYREALTRPDSENHPSLAGWRPPLVGFYLRMALEPQQFLWQALPTLLAALGAIPYWFWKRRNWDWQREMPGLILVSLVAAPYGAWVYDLVLLYIPLVAAAVRWPQAPRAFLWVVGLALAAALVVGTLSKEGESFVWVTPFVGVLYFATNSAVPRSTRRIGPNGSS